MGNLCERRRRPAPLGLSRPPADLASLLSEIRVPEDVERCRWAKAFRAHLNAAGRSDLEALLDFAIVCHVLKNKGDRPGRRGDPRLARERRELLALVGDTFFSARGAKPVPLANRVLRDELCDVLAGLDEGSDEETLARAFDLVWQARCDDKVWRRGLAPAYDRFVSRAAS